MALEIAVQYAVPRAGLPGPTTLHRAARAAWRGAGAATVTLRLVDAEEGQSLNHTFRGRDYATNVLSFPAPALPPGLPPEASAYLGDIVLCVPVLAREAAEQGKTLAAHYHHMVVHGMLHLQGMDHQTPDEAARMEAIESSILAGLGYPNPYDADPPARVLSPHPAGTAPDA
ncbi:MULTISPECIES: rRNA maturation RNase YbeY [unclassified Thioalkalivibrio]|uniref:rRNA maturation RNase YbeY n=1 Tax=unclassified Thioalkalivibrio TaxID=2621013 RepID=UPI00036F9853|nr:MULTISPECIES: rRNA maturation RNase YbeY [unclassified Thioalkalivibrio]